MIGNYIGKMYREREIFLIRELKTVSHGINQTEFTILLNLYFRKEMKQKDLQEEIQINKSNITRMLKSLESKSLVLRTASSDDSRVILISISSDTIDFIQKELIPITNKFNNYFTENDGEFLKELLKKMKQGVNNENINNNS